MLDRPFLLSVVSTVISPHIFVMVTVFDNWQPTPVEDFPGGAVVKNPPVNAEDARDVNLIPGLGRFLGGGNDNPVFLPGKSQGPEKPGGLQFIGSQKSDLTEHMYTHIIFDIDIL